MILRTLILTAFISILLSCNSNSSNSTTLVKGETTTKSLSATNEIQTDGQTSTQEQYADIVRIFQKSDTTFLDADYIQYLTGDAAIEAAKKAHQADTFQTEDGKTHIDVPNDYFIVNESKNVRQLPLSKSCSFDLIINPDRTHPIVDNSLKSLRTIYKDSPFILTLDNKGMVVKVKEVFLP
ncbi:MAG: hypothetical protein ACTHKY_20770 [Ginsengibacter sp.]